MDNTKKTLDESVKKIKFMMNYDSLKTLTEQEANLDPATAGANGSTSWISITRCSCGTRKTSCSSYRRI